MCTECSLVLIRLSECFDTRENHFLSCLFLAEEMRDQTSSFQDQLTLHALNI